MNNNQIHLIGISGKIGSGKDTVGKLIQYFTSPEFPEISYNNYCKLKTVYPKYQIKKYADKLKDIVCLLIECTREQLEDQEFKNTPLGEEWCTEDRILTPRLLLQLLGTDCGRKLIHENIWVNALFADYRTQVDFSKNLPQNCNWIITDVRFPNEADAIKEREGIVIRLTRSIPVDKEVAQHPSETFLDHYEKFDYILNNQGTEEELYDKVYNMLLELKVI